MTNSSKKKITASSTAEYFAKNLQQVGFSSPTKAVLTTLKESVDNALDACEESGILPHINVVIKKIGKGSARNLDKILIHNPSRIKGKIKALSRVKLLYHSSLETF